MLKKEKKPEELFGDLTKAVAAVRLQREGAGFDREKIHAAAKRLAERIPASKAKDPRFVKSMKEALVDRSSLEAFMDDMNVTTFHIDAKKMDSYRKDMKRILDAMEDPKKRSPEYQKMYQCMSAIVKLDTRGMDESTREEMERKFSRANEDLFDALQNYTRNKEKVRFWDSGKDRFNHCLDALATVAAYAPGTKLATMKFIDRINRIRKQEFVVFDGMTRELAQREQNWEQNLAEAYEKGRTLFDDREEPFSVDGRLFTAVENSESGEVSDQTIFCYHQKGNVIWAEYSGGSVVKGFLVGTMDEKQCLHFTYQHINTAGELKAGSCNSEPQEENGRLRFYEKWQWTTGEEGTSIIEEI